MRRVLFQNLSACVDFECKHTILRCGTCYGNLVEQPFKPLRARRRDGCGVVSCKYATEALGRELFPLASLPRVCQRGFARTGWQRCGRHRCKDVCHFLKRQAVLRNNLLLLLSICGGRDYARAEGVITFGQQEFSAEIAISILNSATFEDKEEPKGSQKHQSKDLVHP